MGYDMYIEAPSEALAARGDDATYFRLNIFGMSHYRGYMGQLEMLDLESPSPESGDQQQDWDDAVAAQALDDPTGIPVYKLCSNDGWLVTPAECVAALQRYQEADTDAVIEPDDKSYWAQWIAFINRASNNGGFRVW